MQRAIKALLKRVGIYHPLQLSYRQLIFFARKKYYRIVYRKYKGHGFRCNVCENSYDQFVPEYPARENRSAIEKNAVIAGYGVNIYCPYCLSTARERLVIAMLAEIDFTGKHVLHLSPEKKIYDFIAPKATITTADLIPGFYRNVDSRIMQADALRLPFADSFFDIVIGNHILEHIPEDHKAMKEFYRVLKKGGIAVLQVPYSVSILKTIEDPFIDDPQRQSELFGQKDHVRIYCLNDYIGRLRQTGFSVEYIAYESLSAFHQFAIQPGEGFFKIIK